jgi:hypothetical protein
MAAESYDTEQEPNFLRHMSSTVSLYLKEVFGKIATDEALPSADQFEYFVTGRPESDIPPLASERTAKDFRIGDWVLYLSGCRLVDAKIENTKAYDNKSGVRLGEPVEIPPEELERRKALLFRRKAELEREGSTAWPDPDLLQKAISLMSQFQTVVPETRPGFVRLSTKDEKGRSLEAIVDMDYNTIVPLNAWEYIKRSESYREAYLSSGSKESLRERAELEQAIGKRIEEEKTLPGNNSAANNSRAVV